MKGCSQFNEQQRLARTIGTDLSPHRLLHRH
jgi:hypothetical protein